MTSVFPRRQVDLGLPPKDRCVPVVSLCILGVGMWFVIVQKGVSSKHERGYLQELCEANNFLVKYVALETISLIFCSTYKSREIRERPGV